MKQKISRKMRGFTLTEAAIVLGIVGLILGAIWVAAGSVYNNQRVNTTTTQLMQMVSGIRALHGTQTTIAASSDAAVLSKAGAVPADMPAGSTATTVANVWGGDVSIAPNAGGVNFAITYNDVPEQACIKLLAGLTGANRDTGLVSVAGITAFPINPAAADAACGATTNIVFIFRLRA